MKVLVGDEFGLIKLIDIDKKITLSKYGAVNKKNAVIGINNLFDNNNILSITHEQNLYVLDWNKSTIESKPEIKLNEKTLFTSQVVKKTIDFSSIIASRSDNKLNICRYDEELNMKLTEELEIKTKNLHIIKDAANTQEIICLFKDTPISIYNLETNEFTWRAKNLPNDEFDLKIPVWDVDVAFTKQNSEIIYTATAYGDIRQYDIRCKPRPVFDKKISERKINRMLLSNCLNYLTVGDSIGNIIMHDKRKSILKFDVNFRF